MIFPEEDSRERADAYRVLADLFARPPRQDLLTKVRADLELDSQESAFEIGNDFNDLFLIPQGRVLPLESVFVGSDPLVTRHALMQFYTQAGLTIDEEFRYIPDHLSLEFLFMSYLIGTGNTPLQEDFLDEHILRWVPAFCEEAAQYAQTGFYREIADLTSAFVLKEYQGFE
ncbi:MAG: TorD/DmsD family molecular chaperone [Thermodesulfovibrionales bacterium]